MSHEVRLDCYTIKVRSRRSRNKEAEYFRLTDLSFVAGEQRHILDFKEFFHKFVDSFNGQFAGIRGSESVVYPSSGQLAFASERRLIHGFLKAGKSGVGRSIVDRNNPDDEVFKVTLDHVDSIEYFFILWVPTDSNVGLLVVQGLSTESISDTFSKLIRKFFNDSVEDRLLEVDKFVPKEIIDQMKDRGSIDKITLRKQRLAPDRANSILGTDFITSEVVLEVKISGLKNVSSNIKAILELRLNDAVRDMVMGEPIYFSTPVLDEIGMEGSYEVLVEYEFNGKKATAKKSNGFAIQPYYYVNEEHIVRDSSTNLPTKDSIRNYCLDFFNMLREQIIPNRNV